MKIPTKYKLGKRIAKALLKQDKPARPHGKLVAKKHTAQHKMKCLSYETLPVLQYCTLVAKNPPCRLSSQHGR